MLKGCLSQQWLSTLLVALLSANSFAAESFLDYVSKIDDTPRSSLWMEYQTSDDDSTDFYLDMGLYLNSSGKLIIGIGESQIHDFNQSIDTTNYNLHFIHQSENNVDIGIGYSYWGNDDDLWTETVELLLAFHSENFSLRLQPRFTTLNAFTAPLAGRRRHGDSDGEGLGVSISYYGIKDWIFTFSTTEYDYDADLTKFDTLLAQLIFSNTTLLLSDSFLEKSRSFEIKKQFNNFDLGLLIGESTSAIDRSKVDTAAVNLESFINRNYSLFIETGKAEPESDDPSNYITVGINALF